MNVSSSDRKEEIQILQDLILVALSINFYDILISTWFCFRIKQLQSLFSLSKKDIHRTKLQIIIFICSVFNL